MTIPDGHPSEGSYWKVARDTPHHEFRPGLIFCYSHIVNVFGPESREACYVIKQFTNTKMAMPSLIVPRHLFFQWFVPHVLTDEDLGRNSQEDVKQRIRQRLLNEVQNEQR